MKVFYRLMLDFTGYERLLVRKISPLAICFIAQRCGVKSADLYTGRLDLL